MRITAWTPSGKRGPECIAHRDHHDLFFDDHWVRVDRSGHFDIPIELKRDPQLFSVRIVDPDRDFRIYPLVTFWNRYPPGQSEEVPRRIGFAQGGAVAAARGW